MPLQRPPASRSRKSLFSVKTLQGILLVIPLELQGKKHQPFPMAYAQSMKRPAIPSKWGSSLRRNGLPPRSLPTNRKSLEDERRGCGGGGKEPFLRKVPPSNFTTIYLAVFKFVVDTRFQLERKSSLEIIWRSRNNSSKLDFM